MTKAMSPVRLSRSEREIQDRYGSHQGFRNHPANHAYWLEFALELGQQQEGYADESEAGPSVPCQGGRALFKV